MSCPVPRKVYVLFSAAPRLCLETTTSSALLLNLTDECEFPYRPYTFTFFSPIGSNRSLLTFEFRHDESYWALDDVVVRDVSADSLLNIDGGFETGNISACCQVCNPSFSCFPGQLDTQFPHRGTYHYLAGASVDSDFLVQELPTVAERYYSVSFWLRNFGFGTNNAVVTISF